MSAQIELARVYREVEDYLVPYLRLGLGERVVYYHLLRHSRLESRRVVKISKRALARTIGCSATTVHGHVRRLAEKGCVKIVECSLAGHAIEVFTPDEIPGCVRPEPGWEAEALEAADCYKNERLRGAILRRENYRCFYCLRNLAAGAAVFDHAAPAAAGGDNSYRNIVACCFDCNSRKQDRPAEEHLRELFRASRLSSTELDERLAALERLRAGSLAPVIGAASEGKLPERAPQRGGVLA